MTTLQKGLLLLLGVSTIITYSLIQLQSAQPKPAQADRQGTLPAEGGQLNAGSNGCGSRGRSDVDFHSRAGRGRNASLDISLSFEKSGSFPYKYFCFAEYAPSCAAMFSPGRQGFLGGCTCDEPGCPCESYHSLRTAKMVCAARPECGGVTQAAGHAYELRRSSSITPSPANETSWSRLPCPKKDERRGAMPSSLTPSPKLAALRRRARRWTHEPVIRLAGCEQADGTLNSSRAADPVLAARTPLRGWSSWNAYHAEVSQAMIEATMDALVSRERLVDGRRTSLLDLGYAHVGLDDGWQACGAGGMGSSFHAPDGTPLVDGAKFPSLGGMVERAHKLGLNAGFYLNNCVCSELCLDPTAEARAMEATARAVVALGFDAVKIDSCSQFRNLTRWRQLLGSEILIENCFQGGITPSSGPTLISSLLPDQPHVPVGPSLAACNASSSAASDCPYQYYRTSADIRPEWESVLFNLNSVAQYLDRGDGPRGLSRPGLWAYPDSEPSGRCCSRHLCSLSI